MYTIKVWCYIECLSKPISDPERDVFNVCDKATAENLLSLWVRKCERAEYSTGYGYSVVCGGNILGYVDTEQDCYNYFNPQKEL